MSNPNELKNKAAKTTMPFAAVMAGADTVGSDTADNYAQPAVVGWLSLAAATNGDEINPLTFTYAVTRNVDGTIAHVDVTGSPPGGSSGTYRQTYTYSAGFFVSASGWIKQ